MKENSSVVQISWFEQDGRNRRLKNCSSAGYKGKYPFASVLAIAEGRGGGWRSASLVVSCIRDMFAEGVAYAVGDTLEESFREASEELRKNGLRGCSAIAAAILGNDVWIVHVGNSRVYLGEGKSIKLLTRDHTLGEEMGLTAGDPGYTIRKLDLTKYMSQENLEPSLTHHALKKGETLFFCTSNIWSNLRLRRLQNLISGMNTADAILEQINKESRLRFKTGGGSGAIVRYGKFGKPWNRIRLVARRRRNLFFITLLLLLGFGISFLCGVFKGNVPQEHSELTGTLEPSSVFPLISYDNMLTSTSISSDSENIIPVLSLPIDVIVMSEAEIDLPPDTIKQILTSSIDEQFEKGDPGVYMLAADSTLIGRISLNISRQLNLPEPVFLKSIVVIREDDALSFAEWLPLLSEDEAADIAIIVETNISIARGSDWIRNFRIYANGDLSSSGNPSFFSGDSIVEVPISSDTTQGYRLIVIP